MFSSQIPLKSLTFVCRSLGTMLEAGIDVRKALNVAADKSRDPLCRQSLRHVADSVRRGEEISVAMRELGDPFPRLMVDMVGVAEQTGALPDVLAGLSSHYENNLRLRRHFRAQIAWPVFQFVMAVLVIALLIVVLGWIAQSRGGTPIDVLGLGLFGTHGALIWLMCSFGSVGLLIFGYQLVARSLSGKQFLDPLLLYIPVVGHCLRSFAVARFSWAFALTQQAGMPIDQSLWASFRATANGAFLAAAPYVATNIQHGETLIDALRETRLFPVEFLETVDVAETSGTVPEQLQRLSPQFEDQARRSLNALTAAVSWAVWLAVATLIIIMIFSIFGFYLSQINSGLRGI